MVSTLTGPRQSNVIFSFKNFLCSKIPVTYQQHQHHEINLFSLFSLLNETWNIFWGNSSHSKKVLTLQKKTVRIIVGAKPHTPWRDLFKKLQILSLPCEYMFSALNVVINNPEHFQTNSAIYCVNTRNKHHLHRPTANLTCFQKSTYYSGIKIFNICQLASTVL
jgi:hypothetical protein